MDYNTVKLIGKLGSVSKRVLPNRVNGYEQISGELVTLTIIEGNNIREIVVLEIFHIHIQNIIIRTENNGNIAQSADFALRHQL